MDKINEEFLKEMKIIQKEISPFVEQKLEENSISFISTLFYFSGVVKQLLNEDDDKQFKEMILRYMLD